MQSKDGGLTVSVQAPGWRRRFRRCACGGARSRSHRGAWAALDLIDEVLDSLRPKSAVSSGRYRPSTSGTTQPRKSRTPSAARSTPTRTGWKTPARALEGEAAGRGQPQGTLPRGEVEQDHDGELSRRAAVPFAAAPRRAWRTRLELFESAEPIPDDADLFDVENKLAALEPHGHRAADDRPVYLWVRGFPEGGPEEPAARVFGILRVGWAEGLGVELIPVRFDGMSKSDFAAPGEGLSRAT